jgi:hypothetical protein
LVTVVVEAVGCGIAVHSAVGGLTFIRVENFAYKGLERPRFSQLEHDANCDQSG